MYLGVFNHTFKMYEKELSIKIGLGQSSKNPLRVQIALFIK